MIILDIDDTLIDHSNAEIIASKKFGVQFKKIIPDYNEAKFSKKWQNESQKHIKAFLAGEIGFQEQRRRRIREVFKDESISDNEADEIFGNYLEYYEKSWKIFPDVIPFLERNRKLGLAVLSDGSQNQQELKLEKTGILKYFNFVITAESEGISKPNPAFFAKACLLAKSLPANTFYIGDNIEKDAVGANNAGLNGVWLNRKKKYSNIKCFSIESLNDFMPNDVLQWRHT